MAGVCNKKYKDGKHRAWYMDWKGKQVFFRGTTNRKETQRIADLKEDYQQRIKVGDIPPPKASDTPREIGEVVQEYLDWGKAQGRARWPGVESDSRRYANQAFDEILAEAIEFDDATRRHASES